MKKIQTLDLDIPDDMKSGWQNIVDLLAELTQTPAALIMRVHANSIEVFSTSNSQNNPYTKGDSEILGSGLYCESVMESQQQLIVPNALSDPQWENNPDIELGLVSYCGIPLLWPNGELFGTICIFCKSFSSIFYFSNVIVLTLIGSPYLPPVIPINFR